MSYDWLVSDIDCNWYPDERLPYGEDPLLLDGATLWNILSRSNIQFIWAVFSALPRGVRPIFEDPPYADGNRDLWVGFRSRSLLNLTEIICWDSGSTLIIGAPDSLVNDFCSHFTDAMDLDEENKKR